MKTDLHIFLAAENGVTLVCLPETPIETELLKGFGRHGVVKYDDGQLRIVWDFKKAEKEKGAKPTLP